MPSKTARKPEQQWPAYTVARKPIGWLKPYERNARTHSDLQVGQIRGSLKSFGWTIPVLAREDGTIIAGHGRVEAGKLEGYKDVPVIVAAGWSEEQCRAYALVDNRVALNSGWDETILGVELKELSEAGLDLASLGFESAEIDRLLSPGSLGLTDPDDVPEAPTNPVSRLGDLWLLGKHKLLCGDSTKPEDVTRLLGDCQIDMILTDPPYCSGGFQEAGKSGGSVGTRGTERVANDTLSTRGYMAFMKAVIPAFGAGVVYVFTDWRMWINLFDVVESSGYGVRNMIVWDKGTPGMGVGWRMQHELIMCGVRVKSPFSPKKAQGNVISAKRTGNKLHATEKPVDLLQTIIDVTDMARTVADPFCGSGSTIIACEKSGREIFAMELMPRYTDVSVIRWQEFTGEKATLEKDGRDFESVAAERVKEAA